MHFCSSQLHIVGRQASTSSNIAPILRSVQPCPLAPVHPTQPRHRPLPPLAARQRRPIRRDLLDNVDVGPVDDEISDKNLSAVSPATVGGVEPSDDEPVLSSTTDTAPPSWDANVSPTSGWPSNGYSPAEWGPDARQTPPPDPQQEARQASFRVSPGPAASPSLIYNSPLGRWGAATPAPAGPSGLNDQPEWSPAAAASGAAEAPVLRPQPPSTSGQNGAWQQLLTPSPAEAQTGPAPPPEPGEPGPRRQGRQPPWRQSLGADWGEPDPLTDWGGEAASDGSTGWGEGYSPQEENGGAMGARGSGAASGSTAGQDLPGARGDAGNFAGTNGGYGTTSTRGPDPDSDPALGATASGRLGEGPYGTGPGGGVPYGYGERGNGAWAGSAGSSSSPYGSPYESYDAFGARFAQDVRYEGVSGGPRGPAGGAAADWGGSAAAAGAAGAAGADRFSRRGDGTPPPGPFKPSDIVVLSGRDLSGVLPLAPMTSQVDFFQPRSWTERIVQYLGSLGTSVILSKAAILAGPALLYPIWSPWIRAGLKNLDLYAKSFTCVGLWRAEVLDVQINGLAIGGMLISKQAPVVSMLVGDPWFGGARASFELPYVVRSENIRVGDSVELLVLGRDDRFVDFKVVREVYLPQTGLWLCDYPFVNRDLFFSISIAIEQARRAAAAAPVAPEAGAEFGFGFGAEVGTPLGGGSAPSAGTMPYQAYGYTAGPGAEPGPEADVARSKRSPPVGIGAWPTGAGIEGGSASGGGAEDAGWR